MAQLQTIQVADLRVDAQNPRLPQSSEGQKEALRAFAAIQGPKLTVLARDIVQYGLNPGAPFYVIELEDAPLPRPFVVLEGNRRLTALRALEIPDLVDGAVKPGVLTALRKLSKTYQAIDETTCVIFNDREEARHWIELKHGGQAGGAGIVTWESDDISRFKARTGDVPVETQVLDFLERRRELTPGERRQVPPTSLRRLLETPRFREKIGLGLQAKRLRLLADEDAVAKALLWTAKSLASGSIKTQDIIDLEGRIKVADGLPADITVTPMLANKDGVDISTVGTPTKAKAKATATQPKPRKALIPKDCVMNVIDQRLRSIEWELRKLDLEDYPNSVGVMFRVFIELSCDAYMDRTKVSGVSEKDKLSRKLTVITTDLRSKAQLTEKQAQPVLKACQGDSLLATSVKLMNEYVHNPYMFPTAADLRTGWDSLQPFMIAVWAS